MMMNVMINKSNVVRRTVLKILLNLIFSEYGKKYCFMIWLKAYRN